MLFLAIHVYSSHFMVIQVAGVILINLLQDNYYFSLFIVKYLGLLAMSKILAVNAKAVQVHK